MASEPHFMKTKLFLAAILLSAAAFNFQNTQAAAVTTVNPVLFVTQIPIPREINGNVSNTFLSVVSLFSNHTADTARAGRGGDLWLRYTNGAVLNLTRAGHYGVAGLQHTNGIAVRDPHVHWSGGNPIAWRDACVRDGLHTTHWTMVLSAREQEGRSGTDPGLMLLEATDL